MSGWGIPARSGSASTRAQSLVVALLSLSFLTSIMGVITVFLLVEGKLASRQSAQTGAFYLARSGLEVAARSVLEDDSAVDTRNDAWARDDKAFRQVAFGDGTYTVRHACGDTDAFVHGVVDEERKLNINHATPEMLERLHPSFTAEVAKSIVAERARRPFASVLDLAMLPEFDERALTRRGPGAPGGLQALLTVWGDGKVNINTATEAVLGRLPGLSEAKAREIAAYRNGPDGKPGTEDDPDFKSVAAAREWLALPPADFARLRPWIRVNSEHFTMTAIGRMKDAPLFPRELRQTARREADGLAVLRFEQIR